MPTDRSIENSLSWAPFKGHLSAVYFNKMNCNVAMEDCELFAERVLVQVIINCDQRPEIYVQFESFE